MVYNAGGLGGFNEFQIFSTVKNVSCRGGSDGAISMQIVGGNPPCITLAS